MNTLLISDIFPPKVGGSIRFYWEIYRRLPREQFTIAAGEDSRQLEFDQTHDLRVHRVPLTLTDWGLVSINGIRGYYRSVKELLRLVKANHIDMIHCGRCLPEGLMSSLVKSFTGIPYICYAWGEDLTSAATSREMTFLARKVLHGAKCIVTCSQNTRKILINDWAVPDERIRLIYPGVDTQRFVPMPKDQDFLKKIGWEGRTVILTVSRLQKRKGHDQMIPGLVKIRKQVPDVR